MKTIDIKFSKYFTKEYKKTQIYLHHTVSPNRLHGEGPVGDVNHWNNQSYNIGTYCIIDADGTKYQLFNHSKWSNHLGLKKSTFDSYDIPYYKLDKTSIGIELDSLGPLIWTKKGFTSYAYPGSFYVPNNRVIDYGNKGYKGHRFYEAYTPQQIESLRQELIMLTDYYAIPKHYNDTMWELNAETLKGVPGIWSHTSVRSDKSDVHPQKELIDMLKDLKPKPTYILPKQNKVFTQKEHQKREILNSMNEIISGQKLYK